MENPFLAFFIFVLILFFYIHITAQWKTSSDIEIYESDYESPAQLQEICAVKQPVVFKFKQEADAFFERFQSAKFEKYDNIDVRIKDRQDYNKNPEDLSRQDLSRQDLSRQDLSRQDLGRQDLGRQDLAIDYVPLSFRSARRLMMTDTNAKYFSEKNQTFLEESGLDRLSHSVDALLKPPLSAYTKYDILLGSPLVTTPLRYHLESHKFIATTRGKITVKLCPPKYSKIIPTNKDYENYEFWSPISPGSLKDKELLQKIKFLDIEINSGDILFIPPYWWYSITFSGDPETTVASFTYDVAMNIAAQLKHWGLYYLQQSNIKNRPAKTIVLSEDGVLSGIPAFKDGVLSGIPAFKDGQPEQSCTSSEEVAKSVVNTNELEPTQPVNREIVTNAGTYVTGPK